MKTSIAEKFISEFKSYVWSGEKGEPFGVVYDKDTTYRDKLECIDTFLSGYSSECKDCDINLNENYNVATINFTDGSTICIKFSEDNSKFGEKIMCLDSFWELAGKEIYSFKDIDKKNKDIHLDEEYEYNTNNMYASEMEDIENYYEKFFKEIGTGDITENVKLLISNFAKYCYYLENKDLLGKTEKEINEDFLDNSYQMFVDNFEIRSRDELKKNSENASDNGNYFDDWLDYTDFPELETKDIKEKVVKESKKNDDNTKKKSNKNKGKEM